MSKVMHIRDVPDSVHEALRAAAAAEGLSLTRYMHRELADLAARAHVVRHNAQTVRRTQADVGARVDPDLVLTMLHDGRRE